MSYIIISFFARYFFAIFAQSPYIQSRDSISNHKSYSLSYMVRNDLNEDYVLRRNLKAPFS
jgi:hypothetical protein